MTRQPRPANRPPFEEPKKQLPDRLLLLQWAQQNPGIHARAIRNILDDLKAAHLNSDRDLAHIRAAIATCLELGDTDTIKAQLTELLEYLD